MRKREKSTDIITEQLIKAKALSREHNSLVKQQKSKKKASTKSYTKWADDMGEKEEGKDPTQMKTLRCRQKRKAHIMEIKLKDEPIADKDNLPGITTRRFQLEMFLPRMG